MNINGFAGSIELYFGRDVLTRKDGMSTPVQWRSYAEGVGAYQGEVLDKAHVEKEFQKKVAAAESDPGVMASQDWSGIDAIIERILDILRA